MGVEQEPNITMTHSAAAYFNLAINAGTLTFRLSRFLSDKAASREDFIEPLVTSYIRNQQKAALTVHLSLSGGRTERRCQLAKSPLSQAERPSGRSRSLPKLLILISRLKPRGTQLWLRRVASDNFHEPERTEIGPACRE